MFLFQGSLGYSGEVVENRRMTQTLESQKRDFIYP
jgi:hypothetical protein